MLINLHVRNFALIEEADVDFSEGLNILTGETGAGKSLLIDAVNAALGGRTRSDCIRRGAESASMEMVFSVDPEKKAVLEEMGISTEYDAIVISRKILPGRSIHRINDETVTSAKVRQVTSLLIDIHGQHEHQSLMKKEKHLAIIDQFGGSGTDEKRQRMEAAYQHLQQAKKERERWRMDEETRGRQMDFLRYEIEELENAGLKAGEREELEIRFRKLANSRKILTALGEAEEMLDGGRDSAAERILHASREISSIVRYDQALENLAGEISELEDLLNGLNREIRDYREELEMDPEEFSGIEKRLDQLNRLEEKYHTDEEGMLRGLLERKDRLRELESFEEKKAAADAEWDRALREAETAAGALSEARSSAIPPLCERLTAAIRELNFPYVELTVQKDRLEEPGRNGWDTAEFLISLNTGETPRPLGQVASGGELSRIMLAIKAVLADRDEIPTLIFDEIDTGISGRTAQRVSEKLAFIGKHRQVICITHLPQIASMADRHFVIQKASEEDQTITKVQALSEEGAIDELARLLGGTRVTEAVYRNAREMKELAKERKT